MTKMIKIDHKTSSLKGDVFTCGDAQVSVRDFGDGQSIVHVGTKSAATSMTPEQAHQLLILLAAVVPGE